MKQAEPKKPAIVGTDIVFECRECGKGLVINCRGAGLNVPCPQCGVEMEVPIPEGFDLADLDNAINSADTLDEEDKTSPPVAHMSETDSRGDNELINRLKSELEEVHARHERLAREHAEMIKVVRDVSLQIKTFRDALDELDKMVGSLAASHAEETQKIG